MLLLALFKVSTYVSWVGYDDFFVFIRVLCLDELSGKVNIPSGEGSSC